MTCPRVDYCLLCTVCHDVPLCIVCARKVIADSLERGSDGVRNASRSGGLFKCKNGTCGGSFAMRDVRQLTSLSGGAFGLEEAAAGRKDAEKSGALLALSAFESGELLQQLATMEQKEANDRVVIELQHNSKVRPFCETHSLRKRTSVQCLKALRVRPFVRRWRR